MLSHDEWGCSHVAERCQNGPLAPFLFGRIAITAGVKAHFAALFEQPEKSTMEKYKDGKAL